MYSNIYASLSRDKNSPRWCHKTSVVFRRMRIYIELVVVISLFVSNSNIRSDILETYLEILKI